MTAPTQPEQPRQLTYQEALAAVAAAQAARAAASTPDARVVAAVSKLADQVIAARERSAQWATRLILPLWARVNVYDGAAVQAFAQTAAQHMVTAQTATAQTAAAAQAQQLSVMGVQVSATPSNPADVRGTPVFDDTGALTVERGTVDVNYRDGGRQAVNLDEDATTVGMFNRPARTQRYLESKGVGSAQARQEATDRMLVLVDDNLMLAQRLAEAEILARAAGVDQRVTGLRRIIHPELSRTGTCGLCIAASDRIYRVRELMPIHNRCKCTFAAVTDEFDPADVLNKADLAQLYKVAGGTSSPQLKRIRYQVDEHGELGPTLVPAKPHKPRRQFTAPRRRPAVRI